MDEKEPVAPVSLRLLGGVGATRGGEELDLGGRRQRAVLALLALARGGVVPAERMIALVWGHEPPPSAAGGLQAYVSHLRRQLQPGRSPRDPDAVLVSSPPGYALRLPPDAVDAWRLERLIREGTALVDTGPELAAGRLEEALRLWRGPALAEYAGEPWADGEAARLAELRSVAREQLAAARLHAGEAALLVPELEALVTEEPLREERWRLLVLALYRASRQADALAALRRARAVLAEELGVDPGPALRALEAEVLAQSPGLAAPGRPPSREPVAPVASWPPGQLPGSARRSASPREQLIERGRELALLDAALDDVLDGAGRLVVLEGPAGIGKTRLLTEARRRAADRGACVLLARGSELEREFAFGVARQLFEGRLADPAVRGRALAGAAATAGTVFDGLGGTGPVTADASFAALHGLYWLTVNLTADSPVVLAIDDLQWCDAGSLRFLAYLARRLEGLPLLLVGTLRTGERHAEHALLGELTGDAAATAVRPRALTASGTRDLVRQRLSPDADDAFCAVCHQTTSGNPLLLRQLLGALEADGVRPDAAHADVVRAIGSRAVSSMVLLRLARQPGAALAVARALAVLGDGAALPAVAALAGLPEAETAAAAAALARTEILRAEPPLGFVHPLVRDAVYGDLPPGERELHHERAARALEAVGASDEQVAAHLLHVPGRADPWALEVLLRAGAGAGSRGAPDAASTYLRRALQEPPPAGRRAQVLLELGRLETSWDGLAAAAHLREAYDLLTDAHERALAARELAWSLFFVGALGEVSAFARRAAAELPPELADERQALVALERAGGSVHELDPAEWALLDPPAVEGDGPGARMLEAITTWERTLRCFPAGECADAAEHALADGRLQQVDNGLVWVGALVTLALADRDEAGSMWESTLRSAYERGSLFTALTVSLWRGYSLLRQGDLPEAEAHLRTALEQTLSWAPTSGVGISYTLGWLAMARLEQGDPAGAQSFVERDLPVAGDGVRVLASARAELLLERGRFAAALEAAERGARPAAYVENPGWAPWRSLCARALAGLGREAEALELARVELGLARRWGSASVVGASLRLAGELAADPVALTEAVTVLRPSPARLEHGKALLALGSALLSTEPDRAVENLLACVRVADGCSALRLRGRAEQALASIGAPVPPRATAHALTRLEREILALAQRGDSENEIAQALFLTPAGVRSRLRALRQRTGEE
ncbi:BTAD domain-containing putative transcriptional regulator [Motilibacter aurantiacus]|uniref:BTAD domain-containing putative transcriptional regulator n=1 Tax=Motilibacter aurantiacus TaxID=2714955 RepID=UPI00140C08FD|nr:AAA family ATPase [Motilibacter aurantiacus]